MTDTSATHQRAAGGWGPVAVGPVDAFGTLDAGGPSDLPVQPDVDAGAGDTAPGGDDSTTSRRNSALVATGIGLSRVAGLLRQLLMAAFLGAGFAVDAFNAALKIPNLLQNLLGEGVLSASFIPVYSRLLAEGRREEASRVAGATLGLLTAVAGGLAVVGVVAARPLTLLLAPGFTGERFELTVTLVRILFPGVGFLALSAWCLGILNSHRRFFLSYVAPVAWNVAAMAALVAAGLLGFAQASLAIALAWGTFAGGVAQFAVQLPAVRRLERGLRPRLERPDPGTRRVLRAFVPVVAGRGVMQLSAYLELALASLLATGAVAALFYAQALALLPVSLFGMSVAAAELPELSSRDRTSQAVMLARLRGGLERVATFVLPTAVVFLLLGDLIVAALYQRGAFTGDDTVLVWGVLAAYAVGLLATTASRVLQSAFYADNDSRTPAVLATVRVVCSAALGAVLMLQFDRVAVTPAGIELVGQLPAFTPVPEALRSGVDDTVRLGAVGLALGSSVAAWLEYALLRRRAGERIGDVPLAGGRLGAILLASSAAGLAGLAVRLLAAVVAGLLGGELPALLVAPLALGAAGLTYLGAARALGLDEVAGMLRMLNRRR